MTDLTLELGEWKGTLEYGYPEGIKLLLFQGMTFRDDKRIVSYTPLHRVSEYSAHQIPCVRAADFARLRAITPTADHVADTGYFESAFEPFMEAMRWGYKEAENLDIQIDQEQLRAIPDLLERVLKGEPFEGREGELAYPVQLFLDCPNPWGIRERNWSGERLYALDIDKADYWLEDLPFFHKIRIEKNGQTGRFCVRTDILGRDNAVVFIQPQIFLEQLWASQAEYQGRADWGRERDFENQLRLEDLSQHNFYPQMKEFLDGFMTLSPERFLEQFSQYSPEYGRMRDYSRSEFGALANVAVISMGQPGGVTTVDMRGLLD